MRYLLGPELLWVIICGASKLVAKANVPPTKAMDRFIENTWFWIPLLAFLTFALWWAPIVEKRWLLLRVWVACLVGGFYALQTALEAYSEQGPGIGTAYMMGIIFLPAALVVGTIIVKIVF